MAIPRVFISSTYYDLRYVRGDLERFIRGLGYEPIRHETGAIPYSGETPLEESAYREVSLCDIVVCIVGGRYGSESTTRSGSVTQNELKEALSNGVQVYIFVESNVHSEYSTYLLNKDKEDVRYRFVDNPEVYQFLEQIYALPQNNPVTPFVTSSEICTFLQSQWAGLFQRFLQEQRRVAEVKVLEEMKSVASTLQQLVEFLTSERKSTDEAIKNILLANHPAFRSFAVVVGANYRVFFTNRSELDAWLLARGYIPVKAEAYDKGSVREWSSKDEKKYIRLCNDIFDSEGKLRPYTDAEWDTAWVEMNKSIAPNASANLEMPPMPQMPPSDDLPF